MAQSDNSGGATCIMALFGALGVALSALKIVGLVHWSWWWVTAPFWAPTVGVLAACAVIVVDTLLAQASKAR